MPPRAETSTRACAYPPCARVLPEDAPESKRFCDPRHRTADWKARQGLGDGYPAWAATFGPGDAENASARAVELRELRKHGPVASDRRVQVTKAQAAVAEMLAGRFNVLRSEAVVYAREAIEAALPPRFRA